MGDAEGVPEDHVGVVDVLVRGLLDPFGEATRGVARGLRHVPAGGVELVVPVCLGGGVVG